MADREPARRWTLEAARTLLPDVRERTRQAVEACEELAAGQRGLARDHPRRLEAERRLRDRIGRWTREMEALGLEVKGPWLVDFDNGSGYYCWRWPEEDVEFFHGYDEGFAGRIRIQ